MSNVMEEREETQSPVTQVKEQVQDAAAQAKGRTREQLRGQINSRSTQAGEQLCSTAQAMRRASEQLREDGKEAPANLMAGLAARGERLGSYLRRADAEQLLRDVEDLGRKQPWLFVGGSAVVGFLASRFMRASSGSRYQSHASVPGGYPTATSPPSRPTPGERPTQPRLPEERRGSETTGGVAGALD
jgi:ElaB/YqjD/DUF883 family membrane-anchored ribosome-binding protein